VAGPMTSVTVTCFSRHTGGVGPENSHATRDIFYGRSLTHYLAKRVGFEQAHRPKRASSPERRRGERRKVERFSTKNHEKPRILRLSVL